MGISSEIRLTIKEEKEAIEIYPLESESSDAESFTVDHLLNNLSNDINDSTFDITKITVLELLKCNLTVLPHACKNLNLKYLGLSHNKLDHVPLCLYNGLKYLESLDLSHNSIQSFDMEPECLPYIKKMKLNNNKFDNVPKWFLMFRCTGMEEFNYSNNKAKSYKFMKNSFNLNLIKLKKLELVNSRLIDQDFGLLKCFRQLQHLDISSSPSQNINRFDDLDELFVKPRWKELTVLRLNGLSLSIFPEGIAWVETLRELHICDNSLSWLPDEVEFLVNLEVLNVSNNSLISLPKCLATLGKLRELLASNNYIDGVPDFSHMSTLKTLDLFDNALSTVSFDINTVDFIDLEFNRCDTSEFQNDSYEEKKKSLREKYCVKERTDGLKLQKIEYSSESDATTDSTDSDSVPLAKDKHLTLISDEDENWDLPVKTAKANPNIDSEDDRWQGGDSFKPRIREDSKKERVYISDDDWMFVDCDESS